MAGENSTTTLSGMFKQIYADKLQDIRPDGYVLANDVDFKEAKRLGDLYHQPVLVKHENGITYAAAGSGAFNLNAALPAQTVDAQVNGSQCVCRSRVDYETCAKSVTSEAAFEQSFDLIVEAMTESMRRRREISLFYGQSGVGTVMSTGLVASASGASTIYIDAAEWAPGIWAGMEGAKIIVQAGSTTHSPSADASALVIASVDMVNKKITTTGDGGEIVKDDTIYLFSSKSGGTNNDMLGLHGILSSTSSTVFNVAQGSYSLWVPTTVTVSGELSFAKINEGVAQAMGKGLTQGITIYVNPETWADLLDDEVTRARYTSDMKVRTEGTGGESLTYWTQTGQVTIKPSIFVKGGYAYGIQPDKFSRIGSTDITFNLLNRQDEFFLDIPDAAGYEMRAYYNQALFTYCPGQTIFFTGIQT